MSSNPCFVRNPMNSVRKAENLLTKHPVTRESIINLLQATQPLIVDNKEKLRHRTFCGNDRYGVMAFYYKSDWCIMIRPGADYETALWYGVLCIFLKDERSCNWWFGEYVQEIQDFIWQKAQEYRAIMPLSEIKKLCR